MAGQEVSTAGAGSDVDELIYDCNALRAELRGAKSLLESLDEYGLATPEGESSRTLVFSLRERTGS